MEDLLGYIVMIDKQYWYIIIGVLAFIIVISLIKKAFRLGLTLLLVLGLACSASYVRTNILDANNIYVQNKTLYIMDQEVELSNIGGIEVQQKGESQATVVLRLKTGQNINITVPNIKADTMEIIGKGLGVDVTKRKVQ